MTLGVHRPSRISGPPNFARSAPLRDGKIGSPAARSAAAGPSLTATPSRLPTIMATSKIPTRRGRVPDLGYAPSAALRRTAATVVVIPAGRSEENTSDLQ